jgi:hypothetical protein
MDTRDIMPDPCDNRIIRFNNCMQLLSCVCHMIACIMPEFRDLADLVDCIADMVFLTTQACMTAQTDYELTHGDQPELRWDHRVPRDWNKSGGGTSGGGVDNRGTAAFSGEGHRLGGEAPQAQVMRSAGVHMVQGQQLPAAGRTTIVSVFLALLSFFYMSGLLSPLCFSQSGGGMPSRCNPRSAAPTTTQRHDNDCGGACGCGTRPDLPGLRASCCASCGDPRTGPTGESVLLYKLLQRSAC